MISTLAWLQAPGPWEAGRPPAVGFESAGSRKIADCDSLVEEQGQVEQPGDEWGSAELGRTSQPLELEQDTK